MLHSSRCYGMNNDPASFTILGAPGSRPSDDWWAYASPSERFRHLKQCCHTAAPFRLYGRRTNKHNPEEVYLYVKVLGFAKQTSLGPLSSEGDYDLLIRRIGGVEGDLLNQKKVTQAEEVIVGKNSALTLGRALDLWSEEIEARANRPRYTPITAKSYQGTLVSIRRIFSEKLHIQLKSVLGKKHFTDRVLRPVLEHCIQKDHKRETVKAYFLQLNLLFQHLYAAEYLKDDPYAQWGSDFLKRVLDEHFQTPRTARSEGLVDDPITLRKYESFQFLRRFLEDDLNPYVPFSPKSSAVHLIMYIQIHTGCRVTEIRRSTWPESLGGDVLINETTSTFTDEGFTELRIFDKMSKTRAVSQDLRKVKIPPKAREVLKTKPRNSDIWVFPNRAGDQPVTLQYVAHGVRRIQESLITDIAKAESGDDSPKARFLQRLIHELGFALQERLTSHEFRDFFITDMVEHGGSLETLARYVGHSSSKTTLRFYLRRSVLTNELPLAWERP